MRRAYAVCGCAADGSWRVVCRGLVAAEEFDERLFLGTLVLAWEGGEDVVFVLVIFVVGGHGVWVFVAVPCAAACVFVGACGDVP